MIDSRQPVGALPRAHWWRAAPLRSAFDDLRHHLHDRRFWIVQALVLLATAVHLSEDGLAPLRDHPAPDLFIVLMYALFFVPVIYASLNFGRAGAIPTAIWAAVLALPSIVFFHHGSDRLAEIVQHLTILTLAAVIATRVDREVEARKEAEREGQARRLSEMKYRSLFASAGDAIVVFGTAGRVVEANAAAAALFAPLGGITPGTPLDDLVGDEQADYLTRLAAGGELGGEDLRLVPRAAGERWVAPVCNVVRVAGSEPVIQVVLRDVTERRQVQHGLEAYARQIVTAQEEERQRIARDLHDGCLQSVVLLCRRIDGLEARAGYVIGLLRSALNGTKRVDGDRQRTNENRSTTGQTDRDTSVTEGSVTEAEANTSIASLTHDIDAVHRAAETIAEELRAFSWQLRPSILDDLGLVPAIEWLVRDLEDRTGMRGDVRLLGGQRRLPAQLELGLFRIVQEALHNVERHAGATSVTVRLSDEPKVIRLSVDDNGRGFPVQVGLTSTSLTGKLGLLGMRERARLLGGTVRISSTPGHGSHVEVVMPLPESD